MLYAGAAGSCEGCDENRRRLRNCPPGSNPSFRTVIAGQVLDRCPVLVVTPLSAALVRRWRRRRMGLDDGPLTEATAQGCEVCEAEATRIEFDERQRAPEDGAGEGRAWRS